MIVFCRPEQEVSDWRCLEINPARRSLKIQEQLVSLNENLENPEVNKMLALENLRKVISIDPQNPPISQLKYLRV